MKFFVLPVLILTTLFVQLTFVNGGTYLKLTKIECAPSPKYFHNHTCRLRAINRYKSVVMMNCFIRDQLRNTSVNAAVFARNSANVYAPFLVNVTLNVCNFFERKTQGPYGQIAIKIMESFTNINHSCPYTGELLARDGYFDTNLIPSVVPKNSYKVILTFYENYPLLNIGFVTLTFDFIEAKH